MPTFEITKVDPEPSTWTAKKGPAAGQDFHSYKITAKGPDGEKDYEINRKPSSGPPPLGVVEADVQPSSGDFPDKLKLTFQGRSNGSSGGFKPDPERSRRIERQHSQGMSVQVLAASGAFGPFKGDGPHPTTASLRAVIKDWTDWFEQDLNTSGGPKPEPGVAANPTGREESAPARQPGNDSPPEEASSGLKARLTQHFNKAGLSKKAQQAIVLYRCRQLPATKDGAMSLLRDLDDGATHDQLIAEIHDAARKGEDGVAIRAAELIPSDLPWEE